MKMKWLAFLLLFGISLIIAGCIDQILDQILDRGDRMITSVVITIVISIIIISLCDLTDRIKSLEKTIEKSEN